MQAASVVIIAYCNENLSHLWAALVWNARDDWGREFEALAQQWRRETAMLSSVERKAMHPAYQRIIGMGPDAILLVLGEMQRQPGHWLWALRAITGADPVPADHRGNVAATTEDWLDWGREHRYL